VEESIEGRDGLAMGDEIGPVDRGSVQRGGGNTEEYLSPRELRRSLGRSG